MNRLVSIETAARDLRAGSVTSVELVRAALAQADALDAELGVFISRFDASALEAAAACDEQLRTGTDLGPLHGIPVVMKDIISTREAPTTAQSRTLELEWSQIGDATVVAALRAKGAIVLGKVTTMEFAGGVIDEDSPYAIPRNPWDPERWPGGSSSGSGSAVAAHMTLGALGTDSGGSVRCPATMCGVSGLKPTYGLLSNLGVTPLNWSSDTVGPLAHSAWDCAAMLEAMTDRPYLTSLTGDLEGITVGIDRSFMANDPGRDPAVDVALEDAAAALVARGATIVDVSIPYVEELGDVIMLGLAESYPWHRDRLRHRWKDLSPSFKRTAVTGLLLSAGDKVQLDRVRTIAGRAVAETLSAVDAFITPSAPGGAPTLDDIVHNHGLLPYYTAIWNALGLPALSVPMGFDARGLPLGLQIAADQGADDTVLRIGDAFQRETTWHTAVAPGVANALQERAS